MLQAAARRTSQQGSLAKALVRALSTSGTQQKSAWSREPKFSAALIRSQQQELHSWSMSLCACSDPNKVRCRPLSQGQLQSGQGGQGGSMQWIPQFKQEKPPPHAEA